MTLRRSTGGAVVLVAAMLFVQAAVLPPASAGFVASTTASNTIGTATLGPATSPSAARGACVLAVSASIVVSWATSSLATGYQVKYGTTNGGPYGTTVTAAGGATTSKTIPLLAFSTTYYAVVVATVGGWTSSQTSQVSVTTPTLACV